MAFKNSMRVSNDSLKILSSCLNNLSHTFLNKIRWLSLRQIASTRESEKRAGLLLGLQRFSAMSRYNSVGKFATEVAGASMLPKAASNARDIV